MKTFGAEEFSFNFVPPKIELNENKERVLDNIN